MNREIYGVIYLVINKENNKIYVGQTTNSFDARYKGDIGKNTGNRHLKSSIKKYGIDAFYINKEYDVAYSKEQLDELEKYYIGMFGSMDSRYGYNKNEGGSNGRPSEETCKRIGESKIGELNPMYGKTGELSPMYGKTGELHPMYGKTGELHPKSIKIVELSKTDGTLLNIWDSMNDIDRAIGKKVNHNISYVCQGKRKTCNGSLWMYMDNYRDLVSMDAELTAILEQILTGVETEIEVGGQA